MTEAEGGPAEAGAPARPAARASRLRVCVSWLLVAAWAGFIFFMSSNTGDDLHTGLGIASRVYEALCAVQEGLFGAGVDLVSPTAHFLEYAVFGALLFGALCCHLPSGRAALLAAAACASLYGVTDEFHQLFVEGRMCDPADWAVDTVGALVGAAAARAVLRRARRDV